MASRKEEKERLRREREEAERAAMASESRRRRIAAVLGGLVLVSAVVIIVLVATGGSDEPGPGPAVESNLPARQISDLEDAAEAAGCEVRDHPNEGRGQSTADQTYETNPPTSGTHDPQAAQDGIYPEPPDLEQSVHALEHGRVNIQYRPGTPQNRVNQLEALVNEEVRGEPGYHTLLFENQSEMPYAVAATGWTHSLACPEWNNRIFDAVRAFREEMIAGRWQGDIPELIP
ncbi:MAG TPA: DUF3105 domain-containing protein [Solirubrobacteraceae bacterium]|nr:DUF3105 domain-containing protein [Solirubrobacteraceae bacterium]